jgi:hypothetical protein
LSSTLATAPEGAVDVDPPDVVWLGSVVVLLHADNPRMAVTPIDNVVDLKKVILVILLISNGPAGIGSGYRASQRGSTQTAGGLGRRSHRPGTQA